MVQANAVNNFSYKYIDSFYKIMAHYRAMPSITVFKIRCSNL